MPGPQVSIVSPFYNRCRWLPSFLQTLERQTLRDFELVLVDDGSTDGLADVICETRTRFPLRYVQLPHNRGASIARNIGIEAAQGRYIAFLDSDDFWYPDKLRRHLDQFEAARDRDKLVGLSRQVVVSGGKPYVRPKRLIRCDDRMGTYLFQLGGVVQSSCMFMTSKLAKDVRFPDEYAYDDWTFALRLEAAGAQFEMLPEPLTYYRDDPRPDRLSPRCSAVMLNWFDRYRGELGEGPYFAGRAAFGSRTRKSALLPSLWMVAEGGLRGAVPPWRTAYYLATWACPSVRHFGVWAKQTLLARDFRLWDAHERSPTLGRVVLERRETSESLRLQP